MSMNRAAGASSWGRGVWGLVLCGLAAGCAQPAPSLYQWGGYEGQVYAMYAEPGKASAEEQVARFEADVQRARATDKALPPGFHAHLGFLYFQLGRQDQALQSFRTEAALFPESRSYMDRLSARLLKQQQPLGSVQ